MLYIFDKINLLKNDYHKSVEYLLSKQRLEKVGRIKSQEGKKVSASVYVLLRLALYDAFDINEAVVFDFLDRGKPYLKDYPHIRFNLSHSGDVAACVLSGNENGVDVQTIRRVSERAAKRVLTPDEFSAFKSSAEPYDYFCKIWAIKESYLKKTGAGLTVELCEISAGAIKDIMIHRGKDYYCCVCGDEMKVRHIRRDKFEHFSYGQIN